MSTRNVFSFALLAILILVSVSAKDDDNPDGSRLTGEAEETKRVAGESPVRSESLVKSESLAAGISRRKKRNLADDLKEILAEGKAEEEKEKLESAKSRTKTLFREESEEAKKSAAFIADWKKSIMGMLPSGRGKRNAAKAVAAGAAAVSTTTFTTTAETVVTTKTTATKI